MQGVKYHMTEGGRHKEAGISVLLSHSSDIAEFTCGRVTNRREEEPEDWSVQSSVSSAWALAKHSISKNGGCATRNWLTGARESASATELDSPFTCRMLPVNWEM